MNFLDFFLTDVRNSREKFDKTKEEFAINPAPIASQLSLKAGGITKNLRFCSKFA